jgi:hypothetical protein
MELGPVVGPPGAHKPSIWAAGGAVKRPASRLPRPPRALVRGEFAAVIEPALRDIPEFPGPDLESDAEPVDVERSEDAEREELLHLARKAALADERVQRLLGEGRYSVIGVSLRVDDKERREPPRAVLVAYRYEEERAVEVWLDVGGHGDVTVAEVLEVDYQPPPSDEEIERAIEIARGGRGVAERLEDDFEATAILASDVEPGDRHHGRRRFAVGFGPPDERMPRIRALVDLGAETVLALYVSEEERPGGEEAAR